MEVFLCPIASGAAMSPLQAAAHAGLTAFVVTAGSVLLALGVRAYRRTAPILKPSATPETTNPRPEPGVRVVDQPAR
jgi:hypothetical protein